MLSAFSSLKHIKNGFILIPDLLERILRNNRGLSFREIKAPTEEALAGCEAGRFSNKS